MLRPSGSIADDDRVSKPRLLNSCGATVVVAPFAQSIASLNPRERVAARGSTRAQVIEIRADEIGARHVRRLAVARLPRRVGDDRFDLALDPLGELLAAAGEHLDAVVLERIVRRRDHDAGVVAVRCASDRRPPASARRRRSSPTRLRRTRRARAPPRSTRPIRGCRGRPEAAATAVAVRQRADQRRAEPADGRRIERIASRPCRGRRRCRTAASVICHW